MLWSLVFIPHLLNGIRSHLPCYNAVLSRSMYKGFVMEVSSDTMVDTVGGFFGSTAYVAMFVESLSDGAVKAGVPRKMANELATNLVLSSSKLLKETGKHPAQVQSSLSNFTIILFHT